MKRNDFITNGETPSVDIKDQIRFGRHAIQSTHCKQ